MFEYTITPRVADTDALGHINNTVLPCWFEEARTPLFRILNPTMAFDKWNLILARMEVDYLHQIFFLCRMYQRELKQVEIFRLHKQVLFRIFVQDQL